MSLSITANIVDLHHRQIFYGTVKVSNGHIDEIVKEGDERVDSPYLMPGFIDAHIHIESSMLTPPAFAGIAVRHGTVATVSDPHEIANVCGIEVCGIWLNSEENRDSNFILAHLLACRPPLSKLQAPRFQLRIYENFLVKAMSTISPR
jgi:adenine deaminase